MHELGVIIEVAKAIEQIALENQLREVESIVLQIGEISSMIPRYIEECYPAAVDGTMLEKSRLDIEIIQAWVNATDAQSPSRSLRTKASVHIAESRTGI